MEKSSKQSNRDFLQESKKQRNNETVWDITWSELDHQVEVAKEAKNKKRRRYI